MNWRDPESVYNTFLVAYGDERRAENAQLQSLKLLVDEACR
jgi:hypothetical protein